MSLRYRNLFMLHQLVRSGAITERNAPILRKGADHAYTCTCDTCRDFWRIIGPEDETGEYGPFGPTLDPPGGPHDDSRSRDHHSP